MTRTPLPYSAPDLSTLARMLERGLADHQVTHGRLPGHVEMMNLLARGAGKRNLQELRAAVLAREAPAAVAQAAGDDPFFHAPEPEPPGAVAPAAAPGLTAHARQTLKLFDVAGRLVRWPLKLSVQRLAMWVLWTRFDARRVYTEAEVNRVLMAWHLYGDHATLRRELINHRLMTRKSDCSEYRKLALRPDDEVQGLLQALRTSARERPTRGTRGRRPETPAQTASSVER